MISQENKKKVKRCPRQVKIFKNIIIENNERNFYFFSAYYEFFKFRFQNKMKWNNK